MYINLTHFLELTYCIRTFRFLIECSQIQSLNTCKRVGVSGHIPELLGTWGLIKIILGKSVSQERQATREKIHMGWDKIFFLLVKFVHGKKGESKKESLELVQPWRENYGM
jgi:hypothetical protein